MTTYRLKPVVNLWESPVWKVQKSITLFGKHLFWWTLRTCYTAIEGNWTIEHLTKPVLIKTV